MRASLLILALAGLVLATPLAAQEVTLAFFVTVSPEDVPEFEEAAAEHAAWHGDQGDTQAWPVYQAVTGPQVQYVFLASQQWASLDNPSVDMAADIEHWSNEVAEYTESEEATLYTPIPDSGNPPANALDYPVVQVIEFEVASGGEGAVMNGIRAFKEAVDASGAPATFAWSQVVSAQGPVAVFVAVFAESFAALGTPGPTPLDVIAAQHGTAQAMSLGNAFSEATVQRSSRIWTLRPDLSYFPM